jgi:hypothetical protein
LGEVQVGDGDAQLELRDGKLEEGQKGGDNVNELALRPRNEVENSRRIHDGEEIKIRGKVAMRSGLLAGRHIGEESFGRRAGNLASLNRCLVIHA